MGASVTFIDVVAARLMERAADREAEGSPAAGVYRRIAADILVWHEQYQTAPLALAEAVAVDDATRQYNALRSEGRPWDNVAVHEADITIRLCGDALETAVRAYRAVTP